MWGKLPILLSVAGLTPVHAQLWSPLVKWEGRKPTPTTEGCRAQRWKDRSGPAVQKELRGDAVMSSKYMAYCTDKGRQLSSLSIWDEPRENAWNQSNDRFEKSWNLFQSCLKLCRYLISTTFNKCVKSSETLLNRVDYSELQAAMDGPCLRWDHTATPGKTSNLRRSAPWVPPSLQGAETAFTLEKCGADKTRDNVWKGAGTTA